MTQPRDVLYASQLYQDWLTALVDKAGLATHNQAQAMMRAVLVELRRSMAPQAVLAFANALPPLPRGIFIEGWTLGEAHAMPESEAAFFDAVAARLAPHHIPPRSLTRAVLAVLDQGLEPDSAAAVYRLLPDVLKPLSPRHGPPSWAG